MYAKNVRHTRTIKDCSLPNVEYGRYSSLLLILHSYNGTQ